ncbi:MAG: MmcQ/YjbR family DNA-binding protein [Nocardioidaceae bacterium]
MALDHDYLGDIRTACVQLPEVEERLSHGAPSFFVRGKTAFVSLWLDGHHDNEFPHLRCAAPDGVQAALIAAEPDRYFRPPYVGGRGWIGVRLDSDVSSEELADLCEDAYRAVAPTTLRRELDS